MWQQTLQMAGVTYLVKQGEDDPALSPTCFSARELAPFLALHAARLAFDHPATKQRVSLEAPLPQDFARFLRELGDADV